MDDTLLLKIAIAVFGLLLVGMGLTVYEFREHIMEQHRLRRAKHKQKKA
jgi:hypothetical protein